MRGVSTICAWIACVRAYVWGVRERRAGMRVCSIIFYNFNPTSTFKSACTLRLHTHTLTHMNTNTHTHAPTVTHARTRKTCFPEPFVPRENTVITGISKLKGWPILEERYLGCKSMKLKKSNGVSKSMILTSKSQIGPLG